MKKFCLFVTTLTISTLLIFPSWAGQWQQTEAGWWYQNDDGSSPTDQWLDIDGKQYYFDSNGYILTNTTTPDGYQVGADGAWIENSNSTIEEPKFSTFMSSETKVNASAIIVSFKNEGNSDIIAYSKYSQVRDSDYKSNNRYTELVVQNASNFEAVNSVTIKPGEEAILVFAVKDEKTWYDKDSSIMFVIECDGIGYMCRINSHSQNFITLSELYPDGTITLETFK